MVSHYTVLTLIWPKTKQDNVCYKIVESLLLKYGFLFNNNIMFYSDGEKTNFATWAQR